MTIDLISTGMKTRSPKKIYTSQIPFDTRKACENMVIDESMKIRTAKGLFYGKYKLMQYHEMATFTCDHILVPRRRGVRKAISEERRDGVVTKGKTEESPAKSPATGTGLSVTDQRRVYAAWPT